MAAPHMDPLEWKVSKTLGEMGVRPSAGLLVAVSGGMDSMALVHILKKLRHRVSVAHVNFHLRGADSDEDAMLVRNWCAENQIPYLEYGIDTLAYKNDHNLNTQSAAREIRYTWWDTLLSEKDFDYVATAHHRDDSIETFFLNLLRGTGIKGLTGIADERGSYIRPLINVAKKEIQAYVLANDVPYRTDQSNESDAYQRNRIRHHLIPLLNELNPDVEASLEQTMVRIKTEWTAWDHAFQHWQIDHIKEAVKNSFEIECSQEAYAFLLRWLEGRGFPWPLVHDYLFAKFSDGGKPLVHGEWILSRTKNGFHLEKQTIIAPVIIEQPGVYPVGDYEFSIENASRIQFETNEDPEAEFISSDQVKWPLHIRQVLPGDRFHPLGMNGKSKKLQDFLVNLKLDFHEKNDLKVLVSGEEIIWVIGKRLNEFVRVEPQHEDLYKLSYKRRT